MITDKHKNLISKSWRLVVPIADTAADLFYKRLFELRPDYQALFSGDMPKQKRKLLQMLGFIVRSLDFPDTAWQQSVDAEEDLFLVVLALGRRHDELYHVPDEGYEVVGEALIWTLDYGLGEAFTPDVRDAWLHVYGLLSMAMKMGTAATAPDPNPGAQRRNGTPMTAPQEKTA